MHEMGHALGMWGHPEDIQINRGNVMHRNAIINNTVPQPLEIRHLRQNYTRFTGRP